MSEFCQDAPIPGDIQKSHVFLCILFSRGGKPWKTNREKDHINNEMFFSPFASLINREKLCVNREKLAPEIHHIFSLLVFHRLRPLDFFLFCPVLPALPQSIFFPQILSFWDLRSTLSSREKATSRGWVLGTVLDGVAPQEKKETDTKLLLTKNYSEIIIFEKLRISRVISWKSLSFLEILRVQIPPKITKNNSQGIIFAIISCQRVRAGKKQYPPAQKPKASCNLGLYSHSCEYRKIF